MADNGASKPRKAGLAGWLSPSDHPRQTVPAQVLRLGAVRRAAQEPGEVCHHADVVVPGLGLELPDGHVLDHPLAQRAHRCGVHRTFMSARKTSLDQCHLGARSQSARPSQSSIAGGWYRAMPRSVDLACRMAALGALGPRPAPSSAPPDPQRGRDGASPYTRPSGPPRAGGGSSSSGRNEFYLSPDGQEAAVSPRGAGQLSRGYGDCVSIQVPSGGRGCADGGGQLRPGPPGTVAARVCVRCSWCAEQPAHSFGLARAATKSRLMPPGWRRLASGDNPIKSRLHTPFFSCLSAPPILDSNEDRWPGFGRYRLGAESRH